MSIKYNGKTVAGNYKISASTTASDTKAGPIKIATEQELKDTTNNKVAILMGPAFVSLAVVEADIL